MNKQFVPSFFSQDVFKDFDKFFVGFDDQLSKLQKLHDDVTKNIPNYPPYNIKKVDDTEIVNGMLKIALERLIPEAKQPKKIPVRQKSDKTLLQE